MPRPSLGSLIRAWLYLKRWQPWGSTDVAITTAQALLVLPLSVMKDELRIPAGTPEHDILLTSQITSAVSYVSRSTGATGDDAATTSGGSGFPLSESL